MSDCMCQYDCFSMVEDLDEFRMWQGLVGATFFPTVDDAGNLSWTNNGGLPNPATKNIRGPDGRGVEISGLATTTGMLPQAAEQGEMWAVGAAAPYEAYCYLGTWIDMGLIFPPGPQGETGRTGATPNIQIGTVQTGAAGSQAQVSITGTAENPLLNFVIPKGDKGDAATTVANILDEETGKTYQVSQSVNAEGYLIEEFTEVTS